MKKFLFTLFTVTLLTIIVFPFSASATSDGAYTYTITDGEATITNYTGAHNGELIVPSVLGGCPVVAIGDKAFSQNGGMLTGIVLPDEVTTIGNGAFNGCFSLTSFTIPENVTNIGGSAFANCKSLSTVSIPDGVTSIEEGTFIRCTSLSNVTIPDSVTTIGNTAFYGCTNLISIDIPENVTTIGNMAFYDCNSLTSVVIPDSVSFIGNDAFSNCDTLFYVQYPNSIDIPNSVFSGTPFGGEAFVYGDLQYRFDRNENTVAVVGFVGAPSIIDIPSYISPTNNIAFPVTGVENGAFSDCSSLTSISFPESVTYIGGSSFSNCTGLISFSIPEGVTYIGNYAFDGCSNITTFTIPEGVKSIEEGTFFHCTNLSSITLPDGIISIGAFAFCDCVNLALIAVPESVTDIGDYAFSGCSKLLLFDLPDGVVLGEDSFYRTPYEGYAFIYDDLKYVYFKGTRTVSVAGFVGNPLTIEIPTEISPTNGIVLRVISISDDAFFDCVSMTSLVIPNEITSIGDSAFSNCVSLASIEIPESVTRIGNSAFWGCSALTSIIIPESVLEIGDFAFNGCEKLLAVSIPNNINIPENVFAGTPYGGAEFTIGEFNYIYDNTTQEVGVSRYLGDAENIVISSCVSPFENISLTVSGICDETFCDSNIISIKLPDSLYYIGDHAFSNCKKLKSITIPLGVRIIGPGAFAGCDDLDNIIMPECLEELGHGAFSGCEKIKTIVIPYGVRIIREWTFNNCQQLNAISLPDSVISIEDSAFSGCSCLESISGLDNVTSIGNAAFSYCTALTTVNNMNSVINLGKHAFYGCNNLAVVNSLRSVKNIGKEAFYSCTNLRLVGNLDNVEVIESSAFSNCNNLMLFGLPQNVSVASNAFSGTPYGGLEFIYKGLKYRYNRAIDAASVVGYLDVTTSVSIPDVLVFSEDVTVSVARVAAGAFSGCTNLFFVDLSDGIIIENGAFLGTPYDGNPFIISNIVYIFDKRTETVSVVRCDDLKENVVIPSTVSPVDGVVLPVKSIGDTAFSSCNNLVTLKLPDCITSIGSSAFMNCLCLISINIPETATSIGREAFKYCSNLSSIAIPNSVTGIGTNAFSNNTTIECNYGSYALTYARNNGYSYYVTNIYQPEITAQPEEKSAVIGETVEYSLSAEGTELTYQWQVSKDNGETWSNTSAAGNKTDTISFTVAANLNGYLYRCVVTDINGDQVISSPAKLTVTPKITVQPKAVSVNVGAAAQYTVTATGAGLTYQWQVSKDGGTTWTNCKSTGYNTNTLSFTASASYNGWKYRCVITDANGMELTTSAVKFTVLPKITAQPKAVSANVSGTIKFTVTATGAGLKYQWQVSKDDGSTWSNCKSTGYDKATFSFTASASYNGWKYRCVITDANGKKLTSSAVKVTILPKITAQPKAVSANVSGTIKFTVAATGAGLKYQWQVSKDGGTTWTNCKSTGYNKAAFSFTASASYNGWKYRCVITDANGKKLTSSAVKVTILPKITVQPKAVSVTAGTTAKFTVTATGAGLKYQWQVTKDNGLTYQNVASTGYNKPTFSLKTTKAMNGYKFRCIITDANGKKLTSVAVKLTVKLGTVYWTTNGSVYHSAKSCSYLSNSSDIYSGTVAQSGKTKACSRCC